MAILVLKLPEVKRFAKTSCFFLRRRDLFLCLYHYKGY
jgi:hypothetical protein